MDWLKKFCRIAMPMTICAALLHVPAQAQAVASAFRSPQSLWVGAEFSNVHASFPYQSSQRLSGIGAFAEYKINRRVAVEGDARFLQFGGFENSTESSYLAGPKGYFFAWRKFQPYGKLLAGAGKIHYPFAIGDASYFALAPGGGADYRLSRRWMLRAEYEYQMWLNSPGYANEPNHELTPNGFHAGVAFRIF
jgi:opacity protein-like surface antigen